ncbi:FAD-dependent monooxygenase [Paracraurococcus lichenis]|uniref:FAD-dependent monooxygenase n=1 Tax=Paracraurococcus lichenis TaxID=3064888 RepID=A0ABT9E2J3_9PROT|nr:FAD-dependent monooxygenase [Paracraurococcus sp. LOR1-02]MDO9710220.1 FAD-dependent monooxygenase [Paracraurococcus sp. LOR1-02]
MPETDVLIAGAGPTGLVLALSLARQGIRLRIVDKAPGPGTASRAMVVQARTLELYRQFGIAEEVVQAGIPVEAAHLREAGREVMRIPLREMGTGLSPYPFALSLPQDDHERLLEALLRDQGVAVEWGTELLDFREEAGGIRATLRRDGTEATCAAAFLAGCDGAHSRVRETLGLGFPGGTYAQLFYVTDARVEGPFREDLFVNLQARGLALMLPVRSRGVNRLIGIVPEALSGRHDLRFEDIRPEVEALLGVRVAELNWFSTYHVHHRVAERFRAGRAFIAGDAGHIHSPAGGQGMNTGIGDAVNLAWKLAAVLRGRAAPAILDSYEPERIAFARTLVATTDRAFRGMVGGGLGGQVMRSWLVPHLLPLLAGFTAGRHLFFRTLSQTRVAYHDSPLGEGRAGDVAAGDRQPWVADCDNHAPLDGRGWRLQVHGAVSPALAGAAGRLGLPVDAYAWSRDAEAAGLAEDAAYLLRPDGHVGLADPAQDPARLEAYARRHGLAFAED